jgi:hypothetical protein
MNLVGVEIGPPQHFDTLGPVTDEELEPLRTADLRLPLAAIVDDLFLRGAMEISRPFPDDMPKTREARRAWLSANMPDMTSTLEETQKTFVKRGRGRPPLYGREHYAAVAAAYEAHEQGGGHAPTEAVAKVFGVQRSAAAKWVATARSKYGLLPRD